MVEPTPWPASKVQPSPSPPYMAYVLRNPEPVGPAGPPPRASGPPAYNQTEPTLRFKETRGVYEHFHSPCNEHNRFLTEAKDSDRAAYRDLPRMSPPPFDRSGRSSIRPQSAGPRTRSARLRSRSPSPSKQLDPALLVNRNVTSTGSPCFASSVVLPADLEQGCPLYDVGAVGEQTWRAARVLPYEVPPSLLGHGEGGQRPFHQDYRHYKYFGFAGKGAKTSWACNPKQAESWVRTRPSGATARPASANLSGRPQPAVAPRQPGQPLTPLEAKLVAAYPQHAYAAEKKKRPEPEILEPYTEYVSVVSRQPLDRKKEAKDRSRHDRARVTTYTQPVPGELTLVENPSPNHGSMSPFHQRYSHYRKYGFSGAGATSSWARNPKLAILYDDFAAR